MHNQTIKSNFSGIFSILLLFLFSSCSFVPDKIEPIKERDIPESFKNGESTLFKKDNLIPSEWWKSFNNPELDELIEKVIENNLDLKIAFANMEMLRSQFKTARGALLPSMNVGGNITGTERKFQGADLTTESYSLRPGLLFELDVWGKLRAQKNAALSAFKASEADRRAVYTGIIAQAVIDYGNVKFQMKEIDISQRKLEISKHDFNLAEKKYTVGIINKSKLESFKQRLNGYILKYEKDKQIMEFYLNRLAVLTGEFPQISQKEFTFNDFDLNELNLPEAIPSEVIKNRSDIVKAAHLAEAARQAAGVAYADLFPSVSLSAALNFTSGNIKDLFNDENTVRSVSGNISQTVFAGGSKYNIAEAKKAGYEKAVMHYKKTVLVAFADTENALKGIEIAVLGYNTAKDNLDSAKGLYLINKRKYESGAGSYRMLQQAEENYLTRLTDFNVAERNLIKAKTELHSALGGKSPDKQIIR